MTLETKRILDLTGDNAELRGKIRDLEATRDHLLTVTGWLVRMVADLEKRLEKMAQMVPIAPTEEKRPAETTCKWSRHGHGTGFTSTCSNLVFEGYRGLGLCPKCGKIIDANP